MLYKKSYKFSLIVATLGRFEELNLFLDSAKNQTYSNFEVIIIDQNDEIDLTPIIDKYRDFFDIKHVKVDFKGLARSRNHGIKLASGNIIAVPDDDCIYDKNVLSEVKQMFEDTPDLSILCCGGYDFSGKIFGVKGNTRPINRFRMIGVEYTMFLNSNLIKNDDIYFDEKFGLGAVYKSTEGVELMYRLFRNKYKGLFVPSIKIFHDNKSGNFDNNIRVFNYSIGIGAFIRKYFNQKDSVIYYYIFRKMLLVPLFKIGFYSFLFDMKKVKYCFKNLTGIWKGFFIFEEAK